eukprot:PhF_6_TR12319/c0_g1_i4/m.19568
MSFITDPSILHWLQRDLELNTQEVSSLLRDFPDPQQLLIVTEMELRASGLSRVGPRKRFLRTRASILVPLTTNSTTTITTANKSPPRGSVRFALSSGGGLPPRPMSVLSSSSLECTSPPTTTTARSHRDVMAATMASTSTPAFIPTTPTTARPGSYSVMNASGRASSGRRNKIREVCASPVDLLLSAKTAESYLSLDQPSN